MNSSSIPAPGDHGDDAAGCGRLGEPLRALRDLLVHVGDVEARDGAAPAKSPVARSGSSVWTWTLSVRWSPTTSTESPIASSASIQAVGSSPSPVTAKFVQ